MGAARLIAGIGLLVGVLSVRGLRLRPRRQALGERLAALPLSDAPLAAPVEIRWNEHHVPFIEAEYDRDLAVALGLVHAHLRLTQIEMMRMLASGCVCTVVGPAGLEVDRVLRTLQPARAVPEIAAQLPVETREWMEGFAAGINHYLAAGGPLPPDLILLGHRPRPWNLHDLLAIGRVAATDFTWRVWLRLLRHSGRPDWIKLWQRMIAEGTVPVPSFSGGGAPLEAVLGMLGRPGSNAFAVSGRRSSTGNAFLGGDPHLSITLPNTWLMAGYRSPSYEVVGLMLPGVPAMAVGRNSRIAWGGTSLHAASSELFDVSDLPSEGFEERRERIPVRWWRNQELRVRETEFGPVISDAPLLRVPPRRTLALRWVGHRPSDELTALLRLNRAGSWEEFLAALEGFAVPAQNMLYADVEGRVGQAMAAHLPRRPPATPQDIVADREAHLHWESFITGRDLPAVCDPPEGFVASANNRPCSTEVPVGFFFSPDNRVRRLRQLLDRVEPIAPNEAGLLQRDVLAPAALELRDTLLQLAAGRKTAQRRSEARLLEVLGRWDGRYAVDSEGALAFELLLHGFAKSLHGAEQLSVYAATWDSWALIRHDLATVDPKHLRSAVRRALPQATAGLRRWGTWGAVHRLRLDHPLAALPSFRRRLRFTEVAYGGSNETLLKAVHGFANGPHSVRFGANARQICDLSDLDTNSFVLLGGQDGWLGSTTFLDQFPLWQSGDYLTLPLRPNSIRRQFPHTTRLSPAHGEPRHSAP